MRALVRTVNEARQALVYAKMRRPLTIEEHKALAALNTFMEAATTPPTRGLLRMAKRLAEQRKVMKQIDQLLARGARRTSR